MGHLQSYKRDFGVIISRNEAENASLKKQVFVSLDFFSTLTDKLLVYEALSYLQLLVYEAFSWR